MVLSGVAQRGGSAVTATMLTMGWLAHGELVVVETEDDLFLGTAEVLVDVLVVRNGLVGCPMLLSHEDVSG